FLGATPAERLNELSNGGYDIYTTLDPTLQADADAAVRARLPNTGGKFTSALVSVNPANGYVEALVSGNPQGGAGGYDVVTGRGGTGRQPGSTFKLFTLMAALQQGYSPNDTIDGTAPCTFTLPHIVPNPYIANNAEPGKGIVTISTATADSINCAYIRLGVNVGLNNVVNMAHLLGVTSPVPAVPSMVIGSVDVTPLEMASAYATVDDLGIYHKPIFVTKITNSAGNTVFTQPVVGHRVVAAQLCEVAISVLQQVISRGTGTAANISRPAAGKTGTTDNFTDGWFDGFTPQLVTSVWMGAPAGSISMQPPATPEVVYGGTYPAEIWGYYMSRAMSSYPVLGFTAPPSGAIGPGKFIVAVDSPGSITSSTTTTSTTSTTSTTVPSTTSTAIATTTTSGTTTTTSSSTTTTSTTLGSG
ncbi:MAG: transglycosylase domain-containing protein, partial [Acidimicrobiales bacterium]